MATGGVLVLAGLFSLWPYRHFLSDDGFIYLRFVEHFSSLGILSYNPPTPTYGFTSPLWVLIVGSLDLMIEQPVVAAKIVAFALSGVCIFVFHQLALALIGSRSLSCVATVALFLDPWFAKWMLSGLENPLSLALLVSSLYLHLRGARSSLPSHVLAGLAVLARPELAIFAVLLLGHALWFERDRGFGWGLMAAGLTAAPVLVWALYAHAQFGTVIPNTILAKAAEAPRRSTYLASFTRSVSIIGASTIVPAFLAACVLAPGPLRRMLRTEGAAGLARKASLLVAWPAAVVVFYSAGRATVSGRYFTTVIPLVVLLGLMAARHLLAGPDLGRRVRAVAIAAIALVIAGQLAFLQHRYSWFVTGWEDGIDPHLIEIGLWLREHSDPRAVVAAHEIGTVGYFSRRAVLDTGGLCSPEIIPFLHDLEALTRQIELRAPDFVLTTGNLPGSWVERAELVIERDVQREGSSTIGQTTPYRLYRMSWAS